MSFFLLILFEIYQRETMEIIWKMDEASFEQSFDCLFMTAKCFEAQCSYKEAMSYYNKAVKLNP